MLRLAFTVSLIGIFQLAHGGIEPLAAKGKPRGFLINRYIDSPYYNLARPRQGHALESRLQALQRTHPQRIETFNTQLRTLQSRKPGLFSSGQTFNDDRTADDLKGTLFDTPRWKQLFPELQKHEWKLCDTPDCGAQPQQSNSPESDDREQSNAPQLLKKAMCVTENMTCEIEPEQQFKPSRFCLCIDDETIEAGVAEVQTR